MLTSPRVGPGMDRRGRVEEAQPKVTPEANSSPRRRPLPDHLPREDVLLDVQSCERT
ncbi:MULTISPECIES: hypothetical protein [unclassified Bradyrhizobium]|uniref:IS66 family transposase n=1 Tax=unclassified Bradyrhizobium TaxID=2631580 RepID=UPI00396569B9